MGQFDSNPKFSSSFALFPFFFILKAFFKKKYGIDCYRFCKSNGPWPPGPPPPAPMLSLQIYGKNGADR